MFGARAAVPVIQGADVLKDLGVRGVPRFVMSAADPTAAQSLAGKSIQDVVNNPSGLQGAILRYLGRHRSESPSLARSLQHPLNVPVATGRMYGPGTYFAQTPQASDTIFSNFGDKIYRQNLSPRQTWDTVRNSSGFAVDDTFGALGLPTPGQSTAWSDPAIAAARDRGFLGYAHGDAFTDWLVGTPTGPGVRRVGDSTTSGMFDVRNQPLFLSVKESVQQGPKTFADTLAATLWNNDRSQMPSRVRNFVDYRTRPLPFGYGFQDTVPHSFSPRLDSFFRRIGLDRIWQEPTVAGANFGRKRPSASAGTSERVGAAW
jgi:hypothetical protein